MHTHILSTTLFIYIVYCKCHLYIPMSDFEGFFDDSFSGWLVAEFYGSTWCETVVKLEWKFKKNLHKGNTGSFISVKLLDPNWRKGMVWVLFLIELVLNFRPEFWLLFVNLHFYTLENKFTVAKSIYNI